MAGAVVDEGTAALVQQCFVPRVLSFTSGAAKKMWERSYSVSFTSSMNTFSRLSRRTAVRDVEGQTYDINEFDLEFIEPANLVPFDFSPSHEAAVQQQLMQAVEREAPPEPDARYASTVVRERSDLPAFLRECTGTGSRAGLSMERRAQMGDYRWYTEWRTLYLSSLGASPHEFFNHPLAAVIVVSARDENPIEMAKNLYTPVHPPSEMAELQYVDPNIFCYYVLLHSAPDDHKQTETLFSDMKKEFGANACHLLRVKCSEVIFF